MLDAEALAEALHFGQQVPFLLLDVQRCQDRLHLVRLFGQPSDFCYAEHLLGDLVRVAPGEPHIGQLGFDDLDLGRELAEVVWLPGAALTVLLLTEN